MKKMNAITFARTGHVLGVVTRAGLPDKPAAPADVASSGFRLRGSEGNDIVVDLPSDEIGVALVDYDTRALYQPYLFVEENGGIELKGAGNYPNNPAGKAVDLTVELSGAQVTVKIPNAVSTPTEVWCHISGDILSESVLRPVTIPGTSTSSKKTGSEPLELRSGSYKVAMFAPGYALAVFTAVVP